MKKNFFLFISIVLIVSCSSKDDKDGNPLSKKINVTELMKKKDNEKFYAEIKTSMGDIELVLYDKVAPKAVKNFVVLAAKGFYNGLVFHRVIKNYMIQGGDPSATGSGGATIYGEPFEDEFSLSYTFDSPGVLAMANSGPNTNQSQFFITVVPTPWLNIKHTIFGKVVKGMDVVNAISEVPTDKNDKPDADVVIEKIKIEKKAE